MSGVVVITGGAKRLGRAIALHLATRGCDVAITFNRSRHEAEQTVREMRALAPKAEFSAHELELRDATQLAQLLPNVQREHARPIRALVNNAALFQRTPFDETTAPEWERAFDEQIAVNLKAPYSLCRAFGEEFKREGEGAILNVADVHGMHGHPLKNYAAYGMSKAGLISLTESLALALAPDVRVNALCPGTIAPLDGEIVKEAAKAVPHPFGVPAKRFGTELEVAQAAEFLLFGPGFVTGVCLPLDGGRRLR